MKTKSFVIFSLVVLIGLSSCGTMSSIEKKETYVQYARVNVTPSLQVKGRLINLNDSAIIIVVDGASVVYNLDNIISYKEYLSPDPNLIKQDIVKNTRATASNTGFFVTLTVIGLVAAAFLNFINP